MLGTKSLSIQKNTHQIADRVSLSKLDFAKFRKCLKKNKMDWSIRIIFLLRLTYHMQWLKLCRHDGTAALWSSISAEMSLCYAVVAETDVAAKKLNLWPLKSQIKSDNFTCVRKEKKQARQSITSSKFNLASYYRTFLWMKTFAEYKDTCILPWGGI